MLDPRHMQHLQRQPFAQQFYPPPGYQPFQRYPPGGYAPPQPHCHQMQPPYLGAENFGQGASSTTAPSEALSELEGKTDDSPLAAKRYIEPWTSYSRFSEWVDKWALLPLPFVCIAAGGSDDDSDGSSKLVCPYVVPQELGRIPCICSV